MTWLDDQRALRDVLLAPVPAAVDRLGGSAVRWLLYRRMVRARFADVIGDAFERFRAAIGTDAFSQLVDRFLALHPPTSPYLRDVPGEFLRFVEGPDGVALAAPGLPPLALDVARFECAELEAGHAAPAEDAEVAAFDMDLAAALSPSVRLLELERDPTGQAGSPAGFAACVYRDPKTHEVESLELTPMAARILRGIERGEAALVDIVKAAASEAQIAIDADFVEALGALLADFVERGVIAGSRPRAVTEPRTVPP